MVFDPYEILGIEQSADVREIRAAYRRTVRQVHPDTGGNAALFRAVQEAWEVLRDPDRRQAFDRAKSYSSGFSSPPREDGPSDRDSSSSSENFRRGYEEEAGRERYQQEQKRRREEAASDAWARAQRAKADQERRDAEQRAAAAAWEERTSPYYSTLKRLNPADRKLHAERGVPLERVLALRRYRELVAPFAVSIATVVASVAAARITTLSFSDAGGVFGPAVSYIINAAAIFVGVGVLLLLIGGGLVGALRLGPAPELVDHHSLRENYLKIHATFVSAGGPDPARGIPRRLHQVVAVASVVLAVVVGFYTLSFFTHPAGSAGGGSYGSASALDEAQGQAGSAAEEPAQVQAPPTPPLVESVGATITYGENSQFRVEVQPPVFVPSNIGEERITLAYEATVPEGMESPHSGCISTLTGPTAGERRI